MLDVVVVGSINLDLVVRSSRLPAPGETVIAFDYHEYPGGKGLNQAVAAARSGASVALIAAVGEDDAGTRLRQVARQEGIDLDGVRTVDEPTGRAFINVGDDAENTILVVPGANGRVVVDALPRSSVVLAQLEVPLDAVERAFAKARGHGALTVLNPAPAADLPGSLLAVTDVIVPNEHEVELVGGIERLLGAGVKAVVVTRGASGITLATASPGSMPTVYPAIEVDAVDTTGAGDAFCGALAARLSTGAEMHDALRWAVVAGGLATTRHGAVQSLPDASAIRAILDRSANQPSRRSSR